MDKGYTPQQQIIIRSEPIHEPVNPWTALDWTTIIVAALGFLGICVQVWRKKK